MGEPAKPPIRPSTNSSNFDSIHTTLQPRRNEHALRVLIADDYEAVRVGLSTLLKSVDIEVCAQTTNGEEAVEKSIQLRPDLIILDISMPGIGGVEAARQIRVLSFPSRRADLVLYDAQHSATLRDSEISWRSRLRHKRPNGRKADRSSRRIAQQENLLHLVIVPSCIGAILPTFGELIPVRLLDPLPVVNAQNTGYHV